MERMIWNQELELNTCKSTEFDNRKSITIKVVSTKEYKHSFINGIAKVEVFLDDTTVINRTDIQHTTTYVVEDIDIFNSIQSTDNKKVLKISAMTVEKWQALITANNQCSNGGYNILDNEDRNSGFLDEQPYYCITWFIYSDDDSLTNICDSFFNETNVDLVNVEGEVFEKKADI